MKKIAGSEGQIALIVLIISAIVMTIGLSVSKKSVVETKITTDEELLKQAFNAAESGIDYFLGTGDKNFTASDTKSVADVEVNPVGGGSVVMNMEGLTLRNNEAYAWLVGHDSSGAVDMGQKFMGTGLTLCVDDVFTGSLKVDYFYYQNLNYQVRRQGFNVASLLVSNYDVIPVNPVVACPGLAGTRGISLDSLVVDPSSVVPLLLAVKPIGADTHVMVYGVGDTFPSQGEEIKSFGRAGDVSGGTNATVNRNVRVVNRYFVPAFMLDAITSANNVSAN